MIILLLAILRLVHLPSLQMFANMVQQGILEALEGESKLDRTMAEKEIIELLEKGHSAIVLSYGDEVLRQVVKDKIAIRLWKNLITLYIMKSLVNKLYIKQALYLLKLC